MADVTSFDLTSSAAVTVTTSEVTAGAAAQTIDVTGARMVILRVENNDAAATAYVKIAAGTGLKASQGAYTVSVAIGKTAYIPIIDTARHLVLADKDIDVTLVDVDGVALGAGILSDITLEAIKL